MARRWFIALLVLNFAACFAAADALAAKPGEVTVETPREGQVLHYAPVKVVVRFSPNLLPDTLEAKLNGRDVTERFVPVANGLMALLGVEDGLRLWMEGKRKPCAGTKKRNHLRIKVMSQTNRPAVKHMAFFVRTPVRTDRDDKGVWFISGTRKACIYDAFEAMGYAVATDRLWQCELYRRQGRGRLAEIFGPDHLATDIFVRTIGYSPEEIQEGFNRLPHYARDALEGYVAGFNRRIADIRDTPLMPFEFTALGFQPENWSAEDVLAWAALLLRNFDPDALDTGQIDNAALYQGLAMKFGPALAWAMFEDLNWLNDPAALTYIQEEAGPGAGPEEPAPSRVRGAEDQGAQGPPPDRMPDLRDAARKLKESREQMLEDLKKINARVKMGSYAWVVDGRKTQSGNPVIYSGPQMGFSVPSIVTEGYISAAGLQVSGMTVPGIPAIIIGRTPHHAWSMQVGHADTADYYIENYDDVSLHRWETIKVAGQPDVTIPVFRSCHGPIINPIPFDPVNYVPDPANPIIAWKYAHWGYEFDSLAAFLKLAHARSMKAFGEAIEQVAVSQHFCYADRDGNIAYWMSGRDPVRPPCEYRLPLGFLGPAPEWDAAHLIERSTERNPAKGFFSGWNNKSNPDYNGPYGPFHRAQVIHDYLSAHDDLSFEMLRDLALNIATTDSFGGGGNPWPFVAEAFSAAVAANATAEREALLAILDGWDGHFVDGGEPAWPFGPDRADAWVLMDAWIREVIHLTFDDELSGLDAPSTRKLFNVLLHALDGSGASVVNNYDWFQDLSDPAAPVPQTAEEIIVQALDNLQLGGAPWGTGLRGTIPFNHDLIGPVWEIPFSSRSTYAHCVEYGKKGPVRIESMFPLGQSGNILMAPDGTPVFDEHFFSMTPVYDGFAHRPFPLFD